MLSFLQQINSLDQKRYINAKCCVEAAQIKLSQPEITCSKLTIETLERSVKDVHS